MADIYQAIKTRLEAVTAVTDLVGTRIYPSVMPQPPTYPAIVFELVSNEREERHRGQTGDARPRIQITSWGSTALSAIALAEQVRLAMMGMDGSVASVDVHGVWNAGEARGVDVEQGSNVKSHYVALDFFVAIKEAVA